MTLTFKLDLNMVKWNRSAQYVISLFKSYYTGTKSH